MIFFFFSSNKTTYLIIICIIFFKKILAIKHKIKTLKKKINELVLNNFIFTFSSAPSRILNTWLDVKVFDVIGAFVREKNWVDI